MHGASGYANDAWTAVIVACHRNTCARTCCFFKCGDRLLWDLWTPLCAGGLYGSLCTEGSWRRGAALKATRAKLWGQCMQHVQQLPVLYIGASRTHQAQQPGRLGRI